MAQDSGGIYNKGPTNVKSTVVARNNTIGKRGKSKLFVNSKVCFLYTDDIIACNKIINSVHNKIFANNPLRGRSIIRKAINILR